MSSTLIRSTRMALVVATAVTAGAGLACSRTGPPPPATTRTSTATSPQAAATVPAAADPPAALVQVGETAENLFDSAHAKHWSAAAERLQALLRAVTLEGARRPSDYVAPARAELDAVDRLEAIFAPSK